MKKIAILTSILIMALSLKSQDCIMFTHLKNEMVKNFMPTSGIDSITFHSVENLHDIIPDDFYAKIIELGIEINEGTNPPNINGSYLVSPYIYVKSNFSDGIAPGSQFADCCLIFSEQNNTNSTIKVSEKYGEKQRDEIKSFISGSGNKFTVFALYVRIEAYEYTCEMIHVYSGEIEEGGIRNIYIADMMRDDYGNPYDNLIQNGQIRLYKDGDGFSERIEITKIPIIGDLPSGISTTNY